MPRYKIIIEYDGTPFVGWQTQANGDNVQMVLETALSRFTGENPLVHGAGRTDAGVHAMGQVAHFDLEREWEAGVLCRALNAHVRPHPVSVMQPPNDAELLELMYRYVGDEATLEQILVHNPAKLFGFPD